jgi:glycosyltransferase involved in cell wall biosynthesis
LTPEYPSESSEGGGLGAYVHRMASLLIASGHEPEVFVPTERSSETTTYLGVPVQRVSARENHPVLHQLLTIGEGVVRRERLRRVLKWILQAKALAVAQERRHSIAPFSLVQSADYRAAGLFVLRRRERLHAIRCSSSADLYSEFDQDRSKSEALRGYLERLAMRRADVVYAPSRFLAEHFIRVHKMQVRVLRPPGYLESQPSDQLPFPLPNRYFIHFGQLMERKGTEMLARALPLAWSKVPDLTMVWSGVCWHQQTMEKWRTLWGERAEQVHLTGPLPRANLYAVLQGADAAVLPSQVDNLPNTVIESLMFGIPVLGSRGASIDELVEEGRTGHLVALGDVSGLANTLVRMWLKQTPVTKPFVWDSDISREMRPERAVANLIALVEQPAGHQP